MYSNSCNLMQINQSKKTLEEWQDRPMVIAARYIKKYLRENSEVMEKIENKPKIKKSIACPDCVNLQKLNNMSSDSSSSNSSGATSVKDNISGGSDSSDSPSISPTDSKEYGCLPGCSVVVSSSDHLQRVLDESSGVD